MNLSCFGILAAIVLADSSNHARFVFDEPILIHQTAQPDLIVEGVEIRDSAWIQFRTPEGRVVWRDEFSVTASEGGAGLAFRLLEFPDKQPPVVVAVGHQAAADGVNTEVALYEIQRGAIEAVWSEPREFRFAQEGLCVERSRQGVGLEISEFRIVEGEECVLCPHLHRVIVSRWASGLLAEIRVLTTRRKHLEATGAAKELGLPCEDLIASTVLHEHGRPPSN